MLGNDASNAARKGIDCHDQSKVDQRWREHLFLCFSCDFVLPSRSTHADGTGKRLYQAQGHGFSPSPTKEEYVVGQGYRPAHERAPNGEFELRRSFVGSERDETDGSVEQAHAVNSAA